MLSDPLWVPTPRYSHSITPPPPPPPNAYPPTQAKYFVSQLDKQVEQCFMFQADFLPSYSWIWNKNSIPWWHPFHNMCRLYDHLRVIRQQTAAFWIRIILYTSKRKCSFLQLYHMIGLHHLCFMYSNNMFGCKTYHVWYLISLFSTMSKHIIEVIIAGKIL